MITVILLVLLITTGIAARYLEEGSQDTPKRQGKIVRVCKDSSYKRDQLGRFTRQERMTYTQFRKDIGADY